VIRAVISDFGGVLTSPLSDSFFVFGQRVGLRPEQFGEALARAAEASGSHPLFELERGEITEDSFLRQLEAHLDADVSLDGFGHAFFEHLKPNRPVIEFMRDLRGRGLRTALLTNNVREWEPLWRPKLPDIDAIFEIVVDSAFVGMRKPEPAIYALTLERLGRGLRAGECVFLDDLEINCDAARRLGMHAVRFEHADQAVPEIEAVLERERTP
jgi:epoxide hydrolase-like predicted phosphatase